MVRIQTSNDTVAAVLEPYTAGAMVACERLHQGLDNETFRVETAGGGSYVLRRIVSQDPVPLRYRHQLLGALAGAGLPVRAPVLAANGESVVVSSRATYELIPFVTGRTFTRGREAHAAAAGAMLARYHACVAGCAPPAAPVSDYVALQRSRLQALRATLERVRPRGDVPEEEAALAFAPLLLSQIEQIRAALEGLDRDDLPRLVVHGDYRRGNLIFAGDELVALLDFDRTCHDVRAADLAIALSNLTRSADRQWEMHPDLVAAFVRNYGALQPLTATERRGLPTLILGKAAIAALQRLGRFESATPPERGKRGRKFLKHARRLQWLVERQQIWSEAITHE